VKIPHEQVEQQRADTSSSGTEVPVEGPMEPEVIPVVKEDVTIDKRRIETGAGVRVHKTVHERVQVVDEPLTRDDLIIERVPVGRVLDAPLDVRYEAETTIIPVMEEVLVVEKRLMLKEEVRITRRRTEHRSPRRVTLRDESAIVERFNEGDGTSWVEEAIGDLSLIEQRRQEEARRRQELTTASPRDGGGAAPARRKP
jgi:uncharacterized protein (TIGR02271 family)